MARNRYDQKYYDRFVKLLKELKSIPCKDCQQNFPWYVMDFDHVPDRGKKRFRISSMVNRSIEMILEEVAKCDVVCSNCHRIRTHKHKHGVL